MKKFLYIFLCLFVFIAGFAVGATIAAVDDTGADNGNLNISTNELEYHDIQNVDSNSARGFGINTSIGGSKTDKGEQNKHPSGTTAVSMTNTGHETDGITHATIGAGTITMGGDTEPDLAGLNRDITKSDEITRDQTTHALDANLTIDNRIFTESGRADIANQHEKLVDNTIIATTGAVGTVVGTAEVMLDVATGETAVGDAVSEWRANQSGMATGIRRGGDNTAQDIIEKIDSGTATPEELQQLAAMTADGSVNLVYGDSSEIIAYIDSDIGNVHLVGRSGINDLDNKQGYVNASMGSATDAGLFILTDAEERAHNYVGANEELAKNAAQNELGYYNIISGLTGGYTVTSEQSSGGFASISQNNWNNVNAGNELLLNNNAKVNAITGPTADGVVRIIPSLVYMAKDGIGYKEATQKVEQNLPKINMIDKAVTQVIMLPVEVLDSLTSNGMFSNILGLGGKGVEYLVGEDNALFIGDVSEGVIAVKGLGAGARSYEYNPNVPGRYIRYNPNDPSTYINWREVKNAQKIPATAEKVATGGMSVVDDAAKGIKTTGATSTPDFIVDSAGRAMPGGALNYNPKPSPKFVPPTNPPSNPVIPEGSVREVYSNGTTVFKTPDGGTIRISPPSQQYPTGYWRQTNSINQPINPATGKPGKGAADTHIPLP